MQFRLASLLLGVAVMGLLVSSIRVYGVVASLTALVCAFGACFVARRSKHWIRPTRVRQTALLAIMLCLYCAVFGAMLAARTFTFSLAPTGSRDRSLVIFSDKPLAQDAALLAFKPLVVLTRHRVRYITGDEIRQLNDSHPFGPVKMPIW